MLIVVWSSTHETLTPTGGSWSAWGAEYYAPASLQYEALEPIVSWNSIGVPSDGVTGGAEQEFLSLAPVLPWASYGVSADVATPAIDYGYRYETPIPQPVVQPGYGEAAPVSPPEDIDLSALRATITLSGYAPTLLEIESIDFPYGVGLPVTTYPLTVVDVQDAIIDCTHLRTVYITSYAPDLDEFDANNQFLDLTAQKTIILSGFAPDVVDDEHIDIAGTSTVTLTGYAPSVDDIALLPPVLSASDVLLIFNTPIETGPLGRITLVEALRVILAANSGTSNGVGTNLVEYKSPVSPETMRIQANTIDGRNRSSTTINGA